MLWQYSFELSKNKVLERRTGAYNFYYRVDEYRAPYEYIELWSVSRAFVSI